MKEYVYIKGLQIEKRYSESNVHHEIMNDFRFDPNHDFMKPIDTKERFIPILDFHKKVIRDGKKKEDREISIEGETYDIESVYIAVSPEVEKYLMMPFNVMNKQIESYKQMVSDLESYQKDTEKDLMRFRNCFDKFNKMSRIKKIWHIIRHGYI